MEELRIQKKKCIQLLSFFLSFLLFSSSFTFNVSAENLWSDQYIKTLIENGVFDNSEYSYDSKRTVTYDEFIEMAAKLFHYDKAAQTQEITSKSWFTKNITDIGQEKDVDKLLTRQDAVVMLTKMLKYSGSSKTSKFIDDEQISDYARGSINAFVEKGYLKGYLDGTFRPNNSLSQGEAAKLLCMASGTVYSKKGIYDLKDKTIKGTLSVVSPDITIKNAVIEGDLYISEGVGTGEVKLENVTVKGETIVSGGGMNSVVFVDTKLGTLRVETPDNVPVRIVASGDTNINMTQVYSGGKLQTDSLKGDGFKGIVIAVPADARVSLDGKFPSVTVDSPKAKVDILGGKADNIIISKNAEEAKINVASKAVVGYMEINAKSVVGGTGKLDKVSIDSENVSVAQRPGTVEVGKDIKSNVGSKTLGTGIYNNSTGKSSSSSIKTKVSNAGKVILESGSEGIAGNVCITGLEIGQRYYVIVYKDKKSYPIMKDGKFGTADLIAYDNLEPLETDTIKNLTNYEKYKVVKVSEPIKEALLYSYKEIERGNESLFVEMFFDEPVEFLANKQAASDDVLKNSFVYSSGSENGKIEEVSLSSDKKSILFAVPKKGSSYQISLSDEAKKDSWRLKNISKDNEYKQMMGVFLEFTVNDSEFAVNGPENITVFAGEKAVFQANAESNSELKYQWYRDGKAISGAVESIYSLTTGLNDNGSKFSVKVWAETSNNTREFIISKTAFLTVKSKDDMKVILDDGSEGTAGNACITGLEKGQKYYIISYKDNKKYSVMKNGTLGEEITEAVYDDLEALETDTISNLTNEEKYKVVKVLEPQTEALSYTYKEIERGNESLFVEMFFDEPIEFLVNKQTVSDDVLRNSFVYSSGSESGKIDEVSLLDDKKSILFVVPKKRLFLSDFLSDEAKKDSWRLKNIGKDNEYKQMMDVFLEFKLIDSEFTVNGPDNITVFAGEKAVFQVNTESNSELKYQWYRDGKAISGAIESTYSLTTGLNDNGSKYSVKVWAETSDNTREFIISKTAFLTVKSKDDMKVILDDGSEGTAGNACVTGLEKGQKYYIISYKNNKKYSVMKNGTLGEEITEAVYDDLEALETDTISNLTNEEKYKVIKVLEPQREALLYSYKEIERGNESLFVEMFFDEPIEFLVNKQTVSDDVLRNSFVYSSGSESGKIDEVSLSDDKKSILFVVPKKGSSYQISLSDEAKKDSWRLKNIGKDNEYKQIMGAFLEFTVNDSEFTVNGPEDQTVFAGREAKFEVKVQSEASADFSYQWYKDGEIIDDATQNTYSFITALSDSESKYSAKVWRTNSDGTREFVRSGSALLTVEIPEVLLTENSVGEPDDESITGLEEGSRYYIIVVNENKSYPVMKDGTLGSEGLEDTELKYGNLEPLETTVITGLTNKELYEVVKALPDEDMPLLESLEIFGLTNNVKFLGYVSPTIDAEIPLSEDSLRLKLKPMKESAQVSISYIIDSDSKQECYTYPDSDGYYNADIYLNNFASEDVNIEITVSEENSAKPMIYRIKAPRAAGIIVTTDLWNNDEYDYFVSKRAFELEYYIKYMKSSESFDGISYQKIETDPNTGNETKSDSITLAEGTDYTAETLENKAIKIKMTKNFYENLAVGDKLEFTLKFSSNATSEKVCKAEISQGTPKYNLKFGEPILIDPKEENPDEYRSWLNIFVPVNKESGEAFENLEDIENSLDYTSITLYNNDKYINSWSSWNPSAFEYKGQKGILIRQGLSFSDSIFDLKKVFNKYGIVIRYYKISETDEISTGTYNFDSKKFDIPVGEEVKGNVEFSCTSGAAIEVSQKSGTENEFAVTLTNENKPFYHNFKWENESEGKYNTRFNTYSEPGRTRVQDNDGKKIDLYVKVKDDKPELGYLVANMNSIPKLFLYDYEGEIADDVPITDYYFDIWGNGDLGYTFYSNYYSGNQNIYTVKDLKAKHLSPENITLTIGSKPDGTPVSKTMQNFLDAGYFGEKNGNEDNRDITYLHFNSIRELFAAFEFNPSEDTINQKVTLSAELDEGTGYKLRDNYSRNFDESGSNLSKIVIKDKNSTNERPYEDINLEEINQIDVPYAEATIITYTSGGDCTVFDEDGVIVTADKGLILSENTPRRFSIVTARGRELPKIYKFDITYKPEATDNLSLASAGESDNEANISFINITDDMSKEEIENILKSVENEKIINNDVISDNAEEEISQETNEKQENEAIDNSETDTSKDLADETENPDILETEESVDKNENPDISETEESVDKTETSNESSEKQQEETENLIKPEDETLEESAKNLENKISENLDDESVGEPEEIAEQSE